MARRRRVGIRGGDGQGWRGGGGLGYGTETGRDGEAEAGRDTGRRRDGEAEAGQTSGRTAESAALLRPLRSPSPPPDPEGRGGCSARVLTWTRVGQGSTCGNRTALSHGAEVRVRAGGCAGAPADECGQVASMRALLAKARTGGPLPGGRAGGRRDANAAAGMQESGRRCTAYSAESPGPPPAPAEGG
jgi:hypothetical protein